MSPGGIYTPAPSPGVQPPISDSDAMADYPIYSGEWIIPRSATPSPPPTQEITISGSARNTQFKILVGSARITGDLMGVRIDTTSMDLAYSLGEAPPGGLSSITNIEIDGTSVSVGSGTGNTGVNWITYCAAHLGAQSQSADATFAAASWATYDWTQRHQGTAWIAIRVLLTEAPLFTSLPIVKCDFAAGSVNDWDGSSRLLSNPANAAYYYMSSERFGFDAAAAAFNSTEWDAFADFCDATIGGEARWAVNGALTGQSSRDILELILKHGFGTTWYWGDEWHVGYLKTLSSASATATQDDFAKTGGFRFTNVSRRKLPNRVFAWFTDTTNDRDDCRVAESSELTPSNVKETQIRLELCTSSDMAQRWASSYLGVMDEESRVGKGILHPGVAKNLAPYERLDITSDVGVSDSQWRVTGVKAKTGGFIEVDVRQYSSTALSETTSDDQESIGQEAGGGVVVRPIKFGDIENEHTLNIDEDGHLTLSGDATVWEDLRFPASSAKRLGFSDPDWVQLQDDGAGSTGVYALGFDSSTDQEVFFAVQLPHEWKEASNITAHVHWAPSVVTASDYGVTWALEYTWANIGVINGSGTPVAFPTTTTITKSDIDTFTAKEHRMVSFTAITATSKEMSSMLMCRLYRDVSDTDDDYANDALLLEFDIHYEIDSLGSNTVSSKT